MTTVPGGSERRKAGFWARTVALTVDATVLTAADLLLTRLLFEGDPVRAQALGTLLGLTYFAYF